jgi:hypothetical protein
LPAYGAGSQAFKTTVTNAAQRLVTIIGAANFPWIPDEGTVQESAQRLRAPFHLYIQIPIAAANPVYVTWDNNTAPVVGGPGLELEPGTIYQFGNCGPTLFPNGLSGAGKSTGIYQVNALGAMQFIAAANTVMLVHFTD